MTSSPSRMIGSLPDLERFAQEVCRILEPGMLIGLSGPLGVGKTEFVRQILRTLGVQERVTSPTFVLETQYSLAAASRVRTIYHWDLYRLGGDRVPEDLDDSRRDTNGLCFVEWPEQVPAVLDLLDLYLVLAFDERQQAGEGARLVSLRSNGAPDQSSQAAERGRRFRSLFEQ